MSGSKSQESNGVTATVSLARVFLQSSLASARSGHSMNK